MQLCGHCGSEVKENFSVCSGCGANLRRSLWPVVIGGVVVVFGVAMLLDALLALTSDFSWAMRNGGIGCVVLAIGYLIFRSGWKKRWYRRNA
ncbi:MULTISPECIES: hypothetical protein [Paracoccus]|jgi:lipopolysaccharide export LptBFGC system permease protein LptF|uniref:Uncharacterized protein n=1 Tax=Paracoccus denitrificans (strain Pd 1222) TaxID=318586 RepID=A1B018_PARDP|nr:MULTISPECIES: hypothetical protein [Paracoccus]ABL68862.1 hypothetical protein Pden_0750 [Paracoccus denitrificans PD1222]MBB4625413.1 lipopolysaccharide export LptBFGC system permease protein LptF [Paracoccus denitrificans]MCU7428239.1 hypothetical protein [Paracoccus denitrificans]MDK8875382.1 hypothetical protein [Paracoccus sp. SSJ]QAR26908.1 hypothetical protein EO213_11695 [Paracoccus denitrificans]